MSEQIAAGADNAVAEEVKVNAEVSTDAVEQNGEVDPQATANDGEHEQAKRKGGFQRTIEKLRRENAELRKSAPAPVEVKPEPFTFSKPEPEPKDFDLGDGSYDITAYTKAMIQHSREKDKAEAAHEQKHKETLEQSKKQLEEQSKTITAWRERNAEAIKKYDDFGDALAASQIEASPLMHDAILNSDHGADLAYYFATHDEEALAISRMNAYQAGKAIDNIEAQFAPQDEGDEKEEQVKAPTAPITRAPAPATPVNRSSSSARPFNPLDSSTYKDYADYERKMTKWEKDRKAH